MSNYNAITTAQNTAEVAEALGVNHIRSVVDFLIQTPEDGCMYLHDHADGYVFLIVVLGGEVYVSALDESARTEAALHRDLAATIARQTLSETGDHPGTVKACRYIRGKPYMLDETTIDLYRNGWLCYLHNDRWNLVLCGMRRPVLYSGRPTDLQLTLRTLHNFMHTPE